jgi:hypothetical protein
MNKRRPGFILAIITALVAWFGLALQQYIIIDNTPGNGLTVLQAIGRFLLFFTVLSNILVAVSLTITITNPSSRTGRFFSSPSATTSIAVYIFIVGLVYNIILRQLWQPTGRDRLADEVLHVAVPLLYLAYWFLYAAKSRLPFIKAFYWLAFPAIYLIYATLRGNMEGFYAYPFINVNESGYGRVVLNSAVLMIVFLVVSLLFIAIANKQSHQNKQPEISNPAF